MIHQMLDIVCKYQSSCEQLLQNDLYEGGREREREGQDQNMRYNVAYLYPTLIPKPIQPPINIVRDAFPLSSLQSLPYTLFSERLLTSLPSSLSTFTLADDQRTCSAWVCFWYSSSCGQQLASTVGTELSAKWPLYQATGGESPTVIVRCPMCA